jgi:hypothetical protein
VAVGLTVVLLALAGLELVALNAMYPVILFSDPVVGYFPGAQRFLDTGSPYAPEQVAGAWSLGAHSFIHPPAALALFVPFLALPLPLWWVLPLGFTAWAVWRLRPAPWTWPLMAACLLWPRSTGSLLAGNSDMWAMAFVAAGTLWGWPVALLAIKPTFAPLALIGIRRRWTWIAGVVWLALVAVTLPLWLEWLRVTANAGLSPTYSVNNLPLVLLPLVAWAGRCQRPSAVSSACADDGV